MKAMLINIKKKLWIFHLNLLIKSLKGTERGKKEMKANEKWQKIDYLNRNFISLGL